MIWFVTDTFTKWGQLVGSTNKISPTFGSDMFEHWICRVGTPLDIVTDQGKQFCGELSGDLLNRLQVSHPKTTAYNPQCNSQAEVYSCSSFPLARMVSLNFLTSTAHSIPDQCDQIGRLLKAHGLTKLLAKGAHKSF